MSAHKFMAPNGDLYNSIAEYDAYVATLPTEEAPDTCNPFKVGDRVEHVDNAPGYVGTVIRLHTADGRDLVEVDWDKGGDWSTSASFLKHTKPKTHDFKVGDKVVHSSEHNTKIATVTRLVNDHVVIKWEKGGAPYAAKPNYLAPVITKRATNEISTNTLDCEHGPPDACRCRHEDPKPATYALDDVMEAFGVTREDLETETTQVEAMTTKGGLLKASFFLSGDVPTAAGNVASIMQNNEAVGIRLPVTAEQPDSIAFKREDVHRVIEELQKALDTENVIVPIHRPKDQP